MWWTLFCENISNFPVTRAEKSLKSVCSPFAVCVLATWAQEHQPSVLWLCVWYLFVICANKSQPHFPSFFTRNAHECTTQVVAPHGQIHHNGYDVYLSIKESGVAGRVEGVGWGRNGIYGSFCWVEWWGGFCGRMWAVNGRMNKEFLRDLAGC